MLGKQDSNFVCSDVEPGSICVLRVCVCVSQKNPKPKQKQQQQQQTNTGIKNSELDHWNLTTKIKITFCQLTFFPLLLVFQAIIISTLSSKQVFSDLFKSHCVGATKSPAVMPNMDNLPGQIIDKGEKTYYFLPC